MKFFIALAFVAMAYAVPLMDQLESVQLPEPDFSEFEQVAEPGFMAISIEPLYIPAEVAEEFYKTFEVNPPMEYVHELAYDLPEQVADDLPAEPVNFVDSAPAEEDLPEPINFVDSAPAEENLAEPENFVESVPAEEVLPEPVNFVDSAPAEEIIPEPINFVNEETNEDRKVVPEPISLPEPEEAVNEESQPEPVNFVDSPAYNFEEDMASMLR